MLTPSAYKVVAILTFLTVVSCGGGGGSDPAPASPAPNDPPSVVVGGSQSVSEGSEVTLSGVGSSDSDGTITTVSWSQTAGSAVTLSGSNTLTPTFTAPETATSITLSFQLTVTDNDGASRSATTSVTVLPNSPPTANAGDDQLVGAAKIVTLSAEASTDDGNIVSYVWTQLEGPPVTIYEPDQPTTEFFSTQISASLTFQVEVTDNSGDSSTDTIVVTVDATLVDQPPPGREYYLPGQFGIVSGCTPIKGVSDAPIKILFLDINNADFYNAVRDDAIEQLETTAPYSDFIDQFAIYSLAITEDAAALDCVKTNILACEEDVIEQAISKQCTVDDFEAVVKVAVLNSNFQSRGGELIHLAARNDLDEAAALGLLNNAFIHEFSHNMGLADLYQGLLFFDGSPSLQYPVQPSRSFLNTDGPGCGKWCNSFKPATEYTESSTAICLTFSDKETCVSHNRNETGDCIVDDEDGNYGCCVWSEAPFEYFGTKCVPYWGIEDVGTDCLAGSGCYFGAVYGNYAWRPVRHNGDSLMLSLSADGFSTVADREINKVLACCTSLGDTDPACSEFREEYANLLWDYNFKHRIGSCGVVGGEDDPPGIDSAPPAGTGGRLSWRSPGE